MKFLRMLMLLFVIFAVSSLVAGLIPKVDNTDKIAVIPIKGVIGFEKGYDGVDATKVLKYLETAEKENTIKAILLEINSGGGAVVASKQIMEKVKSIEKPVVSVIYEVGASGAYWIASGSDKIVADSLSVTGSVGVLGSYIELAGLMDDYNVSYQRLVGGDLKDLGNPYRKMSSYEKGVMQTKINMIHKYFLDSVKDNRDLDSMSGINTGVYYLGGEAKFLGLVDELGNKKLAVDLANELAGTKNAKLVDFKSKMTIFDVLQTLSSDIGFNVGRGISGNFVENNFMAVV